MIEAVTVCVNYADYLQQTLPLLAARVDRVVVVSTAADVETADVVADCDRCELVTTDAFHAGGDVFNKGRAINEGFRRLDRRGWVLHIDADVALFDPIPLEDLDRTLIWMAHRHRIRGLPEWRMALAGRRRWPQIERNIIYRGRRTAIGYFQMFHAPTSWNWYPEKWPAANVSDVKFSHQFSDVGILQQFRVYHLEADARSRGVNWEGRKSARFA